MRPIIERIGAADIPRIAAAAQTALEWVSLEQALDTLTTTDQPDILQSAKQP